MPAVPLPEHPSLEQLKKQARLLQRSVRSGHPKAVALVTLTAMNRSHARPAPPADHESPAGRRLAAAIADADAPPVVDPGQWAPGAYLALTEAEQVQLGRYGNLLGWHVTHRDGGLFVFEFGPRQCPLGEFAVAGETITATRFYYDFRDNSSGTVAIVGLVNDDRAASITLSRPGEPDARAVIGGGTFVITAIAGLSETSSGTHLTVRDAAGQDLERLPYRQGS